jgi:hypothetical protein
MAKSVKYTEAEMPCPGGVFVTRLQDGRYGAVTVLDRKTESGYCVVFVAPSSWIGFTPDRPTDSELRNLLILNHHSWQKVPAGVWVFTPPPDSFTPVGQTSVTEQSHFRVGQRYATWESCSLQILLQWRWDHDREALLTEEADQAMRDAEEMRKKAQRRDEMLRTITLDSLAVRKWFDHWDEDLDGPYIIPSRAILATTTDALSTSPKITKSLARKHLKAAVIAFNKLEKSLPFIETTHREDIYEALELMMFASRQPDLTDEIDDWRDW